MPIIDLTAEEESTSIQDLPIKIDVYEYIVAWTTDDDESGGWECADTLEQATATLETIMNTYGNKPNAWLARVERIVTTHFDHRRQAHAFRGSPFKEKRARIYDLNPLWRELVEARALAQHYAEECMRLQGVFVFDF
jgi:hypothetical protein